MSDDIKFTKIVLTKTLLFDREEERIFCIVIIQHHKGFLYILYFIIITQSRESSITFESAININV